ncbi:MAG: acyl-phosphate glycerol 3-phosphate acyltransferase [Phycisphaerae bacterium]|nr:acyl-phosphate glycerol 3-phosphate acyltransferase [Phycisphaerae bacterium]|tara:strand:+ start:902 stop:1597 length:696 start_codon:yes stop_codon:yes gene_type:complete
MTGVWTGCIIGAYLLGSIPFGVIISRFHGVDIRNEGSKNIGATNVGRVLGRKWGLLCFFLDLLKGAVPVAVAGILSGLYDQDIFTVPLQWWLWLGVGFAALLGHMYSLFLRGGGGKGVATTFGALLAMWPVMTIAVGASFIIWFIMVMLFRMVSLASMVAAVCIPIAVLAVLQFMEQQVDSDASVELPLAPLVVSILLAALVLWKHRGNITRIRSGTEGRIGGSKSSQSSQ